MRKKLIGVLCSAALAVCTFGTGNMMVGSAEVKEDTDNTALSEIAVVEEKAEERVEENQVLFSYSVNTDSAEAPDEAIGYQAANEGEAIFPDAFYVAEDKVFIDNPVGNSIMVYQGEDFKKSIPLSWEMDAKLFHYDEADDELKIVYRNLDEENGTHLYLTSVHVDENGEVPAGREISNEKKVLLEYCFDSEGNLMTEYLHDASEDSLIVNDELGKGVALSDTANLYMSSEDEESGGEYVVLNDKDDEIHYVVPEVDDNVLERGSLQVTEDAVYQMKVDRSGLQIYELGEKTANTPEEITASESDIENTDHSWQAKNLVVGKHSSKAFP